MGSPWWLRGRPRARNRALELSAEEAPVVDTGDPLPDGFDAVIPIELIEPRANGRVAIRAAVAPFEHVRAIGEDVVATEVVVPAYRQLRPPTSLPARQPAWPPSIRAAAARGADHGRATSWSSDGRRPAAGRDRRLECGAARGLRAPIWRCGHDRVARRRRRRAVGARGRAALGACDVVVVNAARRRGVTTIRARVPALRRRVVHGVAIRPGHRSCSAWQPRPACRCLESRVIR